MKSWYLIEKDKLLISKYGFVYRLDDFIIILILLWKKIIPEQTLHAHKTHMPKHPKALVGFLR